MTLNVNLPQSLAPARRFVQALVLLALITTGLGIHACWRPAIPPFSGRLSWLAEGAFAMAGSQGVAMLWFLLAALLVALARWIWRRAPRRPSDRWI